MAAQIFPSAVRWTVAVPAAPAAPPVVLDGHIFVGLKTAQVVAYGVKTGAVAWQVDLAVDQSMAADDGRLFVPAGDAIHALRADTGAPVWIAAAGTVTAPLLVRAGWVIAAAGSQLSAYQAADGKALWHRELAPITVRPAVDGDVLYVSITDGRLVAMDLPNGTVRWERQLGGAPAEPLALGDRVYVGATDKHFYCLKAASGEIDWKVRVGAEVRAAAALDDERVYFASLQNVMHALDGTNGAQQWKRGLPFRPIAGPVVTGAGVTVPGTIAEVRVFDRRTGAPRGRLALGATLATAPAIFLETVETGEQLAVAAITGSLDAQWKLSLGVPGPPEGPALAPLTELPGEVVKLPGLPPS